MEIEIHDGTPPTALPSSDFHLGDIDFAALVDGLPDETAGASVDSLAVGTCPSVVAGCEQAGFVGAVDPCELDSSSLPVHCDDSEALTGDVC